LPGQLTQFEKTLCDVQNQFIALQKQVASSATPTDPSEYSKSSVQFRMEQFLEKYEHDWEVLRPIVQKVSNLVEFVTVEDTFTFLEFKK
jgi:hypothetical protein